MRTRGRVILALGLLILLMLVGVIFRPESAVGPLRLPELGRATLPRAESEDEAGVEVPVFQDCAPASNGRSVLLGLVEDAGGIPIGAASVYVIDTEGTPLTGVLGCSSDAEGHFALELPTGYSKYDLILDASVFLPGIYSLANLSSGQGDSRVAFTLERGLTISGWLRDDLGEPVKGGVLASRSVFRRGNRFLFWRGNMVRANSLAICGADGAFEVSGLHEGEYLVEPHTYRYLVAPDASVTCSAGTRGLQFIVQRAATLRICLVDDSSGELVRDSISFRIVGEQGQVRAGTAKGAGRLTLRGIPEGVYTVCVEGPGYRPERRQGVRLSLGEETPELTIRIRSDPEDAPGAVSGMVEPPPEVHLKVVDFSVSLVEHNPLRRVPVKADGSFEISDVPVGTYHVYARSKSRAWVSPREEVTVRPGETGTVTLRAERAGSAIIVLQGFKKLHGLPVCVEVLNESDQVLELYAILTPDEPVSMGAAAEGLPVAGLIGGSYVASVRSGENQLSQIRFWATPGQTVRVLVPVK